MKPSKEEIQQIVDGKTREFVKLQEAYKEATLMLLDKQISIEELQIVIDQNKDSKSLIEYGAHKFGIKRWMSQFNLELFYFFRQMQNLEHFRNSLKKQYSLTEEQFKQIDAGSFIKELPDEKKQ